MQFEFIADRPCLDFVATKAERGTTDVEALAAPAELVNWAAQSGLVDDVRRISEAELHEARQVRDSIFGLLAAVIDGTAPAEADRRRVNQAAARPGPRISLSPAGEVHRRGGLPALLSAVAQDCLDLHHHADRARLRWCADAACTRPFVDRSHSQRRRWCGMKGCGDRAKAATYRRRRAEPGSTDSRLLRGPSRSLRRESVDPG